MSPSEKAGPSNKLRERDMKFLAIGAILLNILVFWVIASGVASGVKAISDSCGTEYVIDGVLATELFCPAEK